MSRKTMEMWSGTTSQSSSSPRELCLINTYGVTECCVYQAAARLQPDSATPKLLGEPLPGNRLLVMRPSTEPVLDDEPIVDADPSVMRLVTEGSGEQGELWIAGAQVGEGYLNLPQLTARRFIDHPLYGRCFRTGDLVSAFPNGAPGWRLVGRSDGQVKIRGQRVELGEIEEVLLSIASPKLLQSAAVVLSIDAATKGKLIAFCVPSSASSSSSFPTTAHTELLSDLLRLLCEDRLPGHMVPARFFFLSALPTTRTGKVARAPLAKQTLPSATYSQQYQDGPTEADETDCFWRQTAVDVWKRVLGLGCPLSCSMDAHFIELGGDSLAALRVCQELARRIHQLRNQKWNANNLEEITTTSSSTKTGGQQGMAPKKISKGKQKEEEEQNGGMFGELLGPLAPKELLKHPRLFDYARHLRVSVGQLDGCARPHPITPSDDQPEVRRDAALLAMLYRACSVGSEHVVRFLLEIDECRVHPDGHIHVGGAGSRSETSATSQKNKKTTPIAKNQLESKRSMPRGGVPPRILTPLHVACANGHASVVRELLAKGASPTIGDPSGVLPIHLAAQKGPVDVLDALLSTCSSSGSKTSHRNLLLATDDNHQSVLHHAARTNAPGQVMDYLLEKWTIMGTKKAKGVAGGVGTGDVDRIDRWQRTPLHWAVANGHRTMVAKLLSFGADQHKADSNSETPVEIAERRARCGAQERPDGMGASVFGDIAKLLGGSGSTKRVSTYI